MALNKLGEQVVPQLTLKDIKDPYIRKNFDSINQANIDANHLQGFKFFEFTFTEGEGHFRPAHGLPSVPKDIVVTKICGPGLVQFNRDLFSNTHLDMTVSDECTIRFFVGTYWRDQEKSPVVSDDSSSFSGLLGSSTGVQSTPVSTSLPGLTAGEVTAIAEAAAAATATLVAAAAAAVPSGCVLPYGGTAAPTGYLLCDGTQVSRVTYAALFAVVGVAHGIGNGTSTFHLPDYRGRFLRGRDGAIARDADRASRTAMNTGGNTGDNVGSIQVEATKRPATAFSGSTANASIGRNFSASTGDAFGSGSYAPKQDGDSSNRGNHLHTFTVTAGGDNETRPINAYVNYIIKT
jgi:hypothetical protein